MKTGAFLFFCIACMAVSLHAQKFTPDAFGYVSDPAFHKLVRERNYQLVKQFYEHGGGIWVAEALKDGEPVYIDQDGREFSSRENLKRANYRQKDYEASESVILYEGTDHQDKDPASGIHYGAKDGGKSLYTRFSKVEKLAEGSYKVSRGNKYGIYSARGQEILPVALMNISEKYGKYHAEDFEGNHLIYDRSWQLLHTFLDFYQFRKALYIVKNDTASGIYDIEGDEIVLPCRFDRISHLFRYEDYAEVSINTGIMEMTKYGENEITLYGVIDTTGRLVLEPVYTWLQICDRSGYFVVKQNDKYGVTGKHGETILPVTYEKLFSLDASSLTGETKLPASLLVFKENGQAGLMTVDKKVLIEPVYDELMVTYIGMIACKGSKKGIITPEGKVLVPMQEMEIRNVTGGTVSAEKNGRRCTLDFYGNCYFK